MPREEAAPGGHERHRFKGATSGAMPPDAPSSSSSSSEIDEANNSAAFSCSLAVSQAAAAPTTTGSDVRNQLGLAHDLQASSQSSLVIDLSASDSPAHWRLSSVSDAAPDTAATAASGLPLGPLGKSGAQRAGPQHSSVETTAAAAAAAAAADDNSQMDAGNFRAKFSCSRAAASDEQVATSRRGLGVLSASNSENTQTACDESSLSALASGRAGLLYHNREPLRLKDFSAEVRGPMDVEQFSHQAELLLDLNEISMDGIIGAMLEKVAANDSIKRDKLNEIRDAIFIPGSSVLMARTIQGFQAVAEFQERGARAPAPSLRHDQSWLCALCNLSQVSKRHMVVARFRQPVNMGENAHEVRLFVLIIVPSKEKSTKDQVETGRTFATMLTDAHFRQLLLRAPSETQFKSLMMARAQQLALAQRLKNRHKYRLDPVLRESISSSSLAGAGAGASVGSQHDAAERRSPRSAPVACARASELELGPAGGKLSFCRNPRTSKLFELLADANNNNNSGSSSNCNCAGSNSLSSGDRAKPNSKGAAAAAADGKLAELEFIDAKKLRALAKGSQGAGARGASTSSCCSTLFAHLEFGRGALDDFTRRLRLYPSDFRDAFVGPPRTFQKTVATIWFLYFGILLPTIAFSSLNTVQTHGHMGDLRKAIIGQAIGGLGFALLGGQPLVIIMTTAPLCLYTKVIHQMCLDYNFHFPAMYAAVGLWNGLFLIIYSLFGFSKLMKWCSRSTEEIFALFIVVAFVTDAGKDMLKNFRRFYFTPACEAQNNRTSSVMTDANQSMLARAPAGPPASGNTSHAFRDIEDEIESSVCRRETSLLFVLLMLGTLWLAVTLYKFRRTPYLSAGKRDILADYALPMAVILMSLIGSTVFDDIYVEKFPPLVDIHFEQARVDLLPWSGVLTSMGLGFTLSLLFFMDQNISAAMVMAPQNKLKKGSAYHYDLLIVGLLNGFLSLYGLPMMHGVLPHSPLHARSLADIEEQVEEGHLREVVVNCRETRVTGIVAHILVLLSLLLIPYPIAYIPRAVLNGLFLYMAVTSLDGLQVFERILLLFTEQSKYPPNHYIRRCPQRKIHQFTFLQIVQLLVMCLFGFSPINIVEMFFPVFILLMIPFRHKVVPKYIDEKYLEALDGKH